MLIAPASGPRPWARAPTAPPQIASAIAIALTGDPVDLFTIATGAHEPGASLSRFRHYSDGLLVVSQRLHRIDTRGAARRNVGGEERDGQHDRDDQQERHDISLIVATGERRSQQFSGA